MNTERELADLGIEIRRKDHGARGPEGRCDCPLCPRAPSDARPPEPAFAVNLTSGAWHCHRCNERGNLFTLRTRLRGGAPAVFHATRKVVAPKVPGKVIADSIVVGLERALFDVSGSAALQWLRDRKLSLEAIRHYRLGFSIRRSGPSVSIPYFADGKCIGIKYRLLSPNAPHKYDREPGCNMPLYGLDALKGETGRVIITEGEFDAIALTQMHAQCPVVSVANGATAGLPDEAREALKDFDEILICTDQDEAGDKGAEVLISALGAFRCRRVRLPKKDANDCLIAGVPEDDIRAAIEAAVSCGASKVSHVCEWAEELLRADPIVDRGACTGWATFDGLIGGLRAGEVTLLTAGTGEGKSSWTIDLARRQAMSDHPTLVASLELRGKSVAAKILSGVAGARWDTLSQAQKQGAIATLRDRPIYLLDHYGDMDIPAFRGEVEYAVRRHGVQLVILDHLHFALGVRKPGEDERLLIDSAAQAIQSMALDLGVHVVLVMHPSKIKADEQGRTRPPEIADLKGSSGPAQFADNVMCIARDHSTQGRAVLRLLKVRSELARLGRVVFRFDPNSLRFEDVPEPKPEAPATNRSGVSHD